MRKYIWAALALALILPACGKQPQAQVNGWLMDGKDATQNRVVMKDEKFEYPKTNVIAWKQNLSEASQPIVVDGKVFVTCTSYKEDSKYDGRALNCIDAFTGKILWTEKYDIVKSPVFSNGNLIIKLKDGTILCIDSKTRQKVWSSKILADSYYYYAIVDDGYYVIG